MLESEKDLMLDTHGVVKGDKNLLNEHTRKLFLTLKETEYNFEGITDRRDDVRKYMHGVLIQRPTIEDIMLAYIGGGDKNVI